MRKALNAAALLVLALAWPVAAADLVNENILVAMPPGYKVDFQNKNQNEMISEMVPSNETVNNWTEMVTVQIFNNLKVTPDQFRARMQKLWSNSCAGSRFNDVGKGVENGYPTLVWMQTCPRNASTGKPEITWFKALQGNDSFYVVQKAFKFKPSEEQVAQSMQYLKSASLCDSRISDRACPKQ
jgi:hypothetical protein